MNTNFKIENTFIKGIHVLESLQFKDNRGSFFRALDNSVIEENYSEFNVAAVNISHTTKLGTIRGMHLQQSPFEEIKIVRCLKGMIFDVAVDMRKDSDTYKKWFGIYLKENDGKALAIDKGCAHGFQTMKENCTVLYIHSNVYDKRSEMGVRFNDPEIDIKWPQEITLVSERDKSFDLIT